MQMQQIMADLRDNPPTQIDNHKVTAVLDYKTLKRTELKTGETTKIDCISGDVFVLEFGDRRRRITIRPSGTEPKLKFYNQWHTEASNPKSDYDEVMQELENTSRELEGILLARISSC